MRRSRGGGIFGAVARGFALAMFGVILGLLAVESVPRLLPRIMPVGFRRLERAYTGRSKWEQMMLQDPYLGYRPKPHLDIQFPSEGRRIRIRTTDYGLGDIGFRDIGARPPFDAVALGDSFTFCDDVPATDCWVSRLAETTGLSIASLGISGFSTLAEARVMQRYGTKLHPKLVLVGVFANDFNDNLDFDEWLHSGGGDFWDWRRQRAGRGHLDRWLARYSVTYRVLNGFVQGWHRKNYRYKKDGLDFVFRTDRWWLADDNRSQAREDGWELMQRALLNMREMAAGVGAKLVVVLIPSKEEVYWNIVQSDLPEEARREVDHPLDVVRDFCEERSIASCELRPALQREAELGRQLYLRVSGHWNSAGNAVGAAAIAACLRERGLVSETTHQVRAAAVPQ